MIRLAARLGRERGRDGDAPPVTASYFVCGSNRCGTNLLAGLLDSSGLAGRPYEWFWREFAAQCRAEWDVPDDAGAYVNAVLRNTASPNGVVGVKLMWAYLPEFLTMLRSLKGPRAESDVELLARWFPRPRFVWMWREDVVAQAVSLARATQTGAWASMQEALAEPAFDFEAIDRGVRFLARQRAGWEEWFQAHGIEPHTVTYEELVEDLDGVARRVLDFLEIPVPPEVELHPGPFRKQADAVNAEWIARYRELKAGSLSSPA